MLAWDLRQTTSTGSNSITYEKLIVSYRYQYQGKTYISDRLDLSLGLDNFSSHRRYRQMEMLRQPQLVAFVNPDQPQQSLLDRSLPGALVSFLVLFMLLPCGIGTLFMLSWLFKAWNHFSQREDDRFLILLPFALLGSWCITEIILRLRDARRSATPRYKFREQVLTRLRR